MVAVENTIRVNEVRIAVVSDPRRAPPAGKRDTGVAADVTIRVHAARNVVVVINRIEKLIFYVGTFTARWNHRPQR